MALRRRKSRRVAGKRKAKRRLIKKVEKRAPDNGKVKSTQIQKPGQGELAPNTDEIALTHERPAATTRRAGSLVWVMAFACGVSTANLIYAQPLLATMARRFTVPITQIGWTASLGQLGYALGLVLIVPLAAKYNQRWLIVLLQCASALALTFMAMAPTVALLTAASCAVGLTSVTAEVIIPFAASIAPPDARGRVVGAMLCGLLLGTPLASILSGFVGEHLGWRAMYWIAAVMMIALAGALHLLLPEDRTEKVQVGYAQLLRSLWELLRSEPELQEISLLGMLVYAAFTAFWTTLSFILSTPPYSYGSDIVGVFGLVGIGGAIAALFVGRFTDGNDARLANGVALAVILLAFVGMWLTGRRWIIGLIVGVLLLDLGVQSNQAANESRIYKLNPTTWNRLNAVYILLFCISGSIGSVLGTWSWSIFEWNGVYGLACCLLMVALCFYTLHSHRIRQWRTGPGSLWVAHHLET